MLIMIKKTFRNNILITSLLLTAAIASPHQASAQIDMTQKEFHLALLLFRNIGRPLSRGHIREEVWGHDSDVPSRTMDTHVSRVRTKLGLRPEDGYLLAPVYSYGYRLEHLKAETPQE